MVRKFLSISRIVRLSIVILVISLSFSTFRFSHAEAVENSWKIMANLPDSGLGPGVAVVNGKIYVIGGTGKEGYLSTNVEYDPATNNWALRKPMPTPREAFGIAVYKNKIYCIGGGDGSDQGVTGVNEVYDPLTDTWETKRPMPTPREGICAQVVNGKIYVIGGSKPFNPNMPSTVPNVNEVYDPETNTWTSKTPPPVKVSFYASAVVDNKIYIIGGSPIGNLTQIYDPEADTWSFGAPIPNPCWGAAAGATTGIYTPKRIYVIGGYPTFDLNQVYDPETDTWTMSAPMPARGYGLGIAVINDTLYAIVGGKVLRYTPIGYNGPPSRSELFPQIWVATATAATIGGAALITYFAKIKKATMKAKQPKTPSNNKHSLTYNLTLYKFTMRVLSRRKVYQNRLYRDIHTYSFSVS